MGETKRSNYDAVSMIIHWVTAVLMIFMVFWGEDLMKDGERMAKSGDATNATFEPSIHASIGITILALTLLRILWRVTHTAPAYPATMKRYEVVASKAVHGLFYLLLIGIPLTGWLTFGGFSEEVPAMAGIQIFGAFPLPQPPLAVRYSRSCMNWAAISPWC